MVVSMRPKYHVKSKVQEGSLPIQSKLSHAAI
jgi:hypothetical protein